MPFFTPPVASQFCQQTFARRLMLACFLHSVELSTNQTIKNCGQKYHFSRSSCLTSLGQSSLDFF